MIFTTDKFKNSLWRVLIASWYITIVAAVFREGLFSIPVPVIGGHIFLFRIILPITVALFLFWIFRFERNFWRTLKKMDWCWLLLCAVMLLYGIISVFWAIDLHAWLSKLVTVGYSLLFVVLYWFFARDKKVHRHMLLVFFATILLCAVGGFLEGFFGSFFETPYAGEYNFWFFGKPIYSPILCFYNTNGFAATLVFALTVGKIYLATNWDEMTPKYRRGSLIALTVFDVLCYWLLCVACARLCMISFWIIFVGFAIWLFCRYKKGLLILLIPLLIFVLVVHVGENNRSVFDFINSLKVPAAGDNAPPSVDSDESQEPPADNESDEGMVTTQESDNIRLNMIKNGLDMTLKSKLLGVGVGNGEVLLSQYDNISDINNFHCFIVEVLAEFGLFVILPLLAILALLFKNWWRLLRKALRTKNMRLLSSVMLQICVLSIFPFASMANSTSWGLMAMWIYLGYILCANADSGDEDKKGEEAPEPAQATQPQNVTEQKEQI